MTKTSFDRLDMLSMGKEIKNDVFTALVGVQGMKFLPEAYNQFVLTGLVLNNLVVRTQVLEQVSGLLRENKLTEDRINATIEYLCKEVDIEAERFHRQIELINEVIEAPDARH